MEVHFLGVRGSTSAPGPEFARYGGNTSCVAIGLDGAPPTLLLDVGTGARRLTGLLGDQPFRGTVLLSHLHWDHTHGLPFTRALDRADADVDLHLPRQLEGPGAGESALEVLSRAMGPPHFPITPEGLKGRWDLHTIDAGEHRFGPFAVTAIDLPHPGGRTFGYRVSDGTTTIAYASDHGPSLIGPGPDGLGERHPSALALADGVDLLVHDAQHTAEELPSRVHFGHSAIDYAIDLAARAGAVRVALFHHDPDRTDVALDTIATDLAGRTEPEVIVAREDLVLRL